MRRKEVYCLLLAFLMFMFQSVYASSMQQKVDIAYSQAQRYVNVVPLSKLYKKVASWRKIPYKKYWLAFICFRQTVVQISKNEDAQSYLDKGINLLNHCNDSESLALLAQMQSMTLPQKKGVEAGALYRICLNNAKASAKKNPRNVRSWYVLGVLDYYTPVQMGGKTKCEEYLKKAISVSDKRKHGFWLPGWGLEESYGLLITYYLDKGLKNKARNAYRQAKKVFPSSQSLRQFEKIVNR